MKKIFKYISISIVLVLLLSACIAQNGDKNEEGYGVEYFTARFLSEASAVTIAENGISFTDGTGATITILNRPASVMSLYPSLTTLWYEAGGALKATVGGKSAAELYVEQIGRDITKDDGIKVVALSAQASTWDAETIFYNSPDLIICSSAMGGYAKIADRAKALGITVIEADYEDFGDYLKWFKVFSYLSGNEGLYNSVALAVLDDVVNKLASIDRAALPRPRAVSLFPSAGGFLVNSSSTVLGAMLEDAGAETPEFAKNAGEARIPLNVETLYLSDPDYIFIQCHGGSDEAKAMLETLYGENPVWKSLSAVKYDRIIYLGKALFHNKPNAAFSLAYDVLIADLYDGGK
jgi:ABC-type Fe3+-hydroxamate transport system, periplasmic component